MVPLYRDFQRFRQRIVTVVHMGDVIRIVGLPAPMMKIKSISTVFSLIFVAAIALTGCGGTQAAKEAAKPDQIVIGVQTIPSGEPLVKAQYEKEFGTKVVLKQFDSGRDVNTAMDLCSCGRDDCCNAWCWLYAYGCAQPFTAGYCNSWNVADRYCWQNNG